MRHEPNKSKNKYQFDKEFTRKHLKVTPYVVANPKGIAFLNKMMSMQSAPIVDGVSRTARWIKGMDGKDVKLYIYQKDEDADVTKPVVLFIHGGAFYIDYLPVYHTIASNYAKYADCKVVSVCYRTLLTTTYQTSLDDCYQALNWVHDNADKYCWDCDKIAVVGDSAGGTLSAALTHLTRDLNGPKIAYQVLVYPCTTLKEDQQSMVDFPDTPGWNSSLHHSLFRYIIPSLDDDMKKYFNLTDMTNFEGICDAFVEVEEFDCLRDQGIEYAKVLQENGCNVELVQMKGTFHAFDQDQSLEITKRAMEVRCNKLREAWKMEDMSKEGVL